MFETGVRQLRMVLSTIWGRPFDTGSLSRLVADAVATITEFGELGLEAREVIETPFADAEERADHADRSLRRTARRLAERSPFYAEHFAAHGFVPRTAGAAALLDLPVTTKSDVVGRPHDFVCHGSHPHLATRTTGTTGRALEIWLSRYELEVAAALGALSAVLHDELHADDLVQVHVSSRATAAVQLASLTCRLVGARCRVMGIVPADDALDALAGDATAMSVNASYLAELVVAAERRGLGPADFRLRRVDCVSEILSPAVRRAAERTFGAPVSDNFGMTETIPVTGTSCSAGHLHHDLTMGHVEVLGLRSGSPAEPGELGTLVVTPYFPYRECMPVFRYDTRDVVRAPAGPASCELAGIPGTSAVLGKASQLVEVTPERLVTPRELVEAVEDLPGRPWPARFHAEVDGDGRLRLDLPARAVSGLSSAGLADHFAERGLDARVRVLDDDQAAGLRRVRSDLRELTFAALQPVGA
ncbi:phenylacetate--CoA ligase family protein [Cellulomonas sp. NPDC055163]